MRLSVHKTLKMYQGGKFIRSESGRVLPTTSADGSPMNAAHASRKDLRNSVGINRKAQSGWAGRTAYNRGQILYRLGEMLEGRGDSLPTSDKDWQAAVDRAVHHAGWTDKITAILSSLNPVSGAYVNYSMIKPLGVVVAFPHADDGLLGLVETACQILVMGNAGTIIVPTERAELATAFTECLHTCDLPGGTLDVLTGKVEELLPVADTHDDVDSILVVDGAVTQQQWADSQREGAQVLRRLVQTGRAASPAGPETFAKLCEVKTVWMSAMNEIPAGRVAY